jgi:oligopeptide/dipeptide ABC transporter ATP-binding protein
MSGQVPILELKDVSIGLQVGKTTYSLLDSIDFKLKSGEILALVGESGSGKTMTALAIIGLLPQNARVLSGEILFEGRNILDMTPKEKQHLRRSSIATVFQDPMNYLNPLMTIGEQLMEVSPPSATSREDKVQSSLDSLTKAGFREPRLVLHKYPHELSGGMCQRAMLAMALIRAPSMLIADEITTGIDVTTQAALLEHLKHLKETLGISVLMITHDMGVVANTCDRMVVLYAGSICEAGDVQKVLKKPLHPYTKDLLASIPKIGSTNLEQIRGYVPMITDLPKGCRFNPRCKYAMNICREKRPSLIQTEGRAVACYAVNGDNPNVA